MSKNWKIGGESELCYDCAGYRYLLFINIFLLFKKKITTTNNNN